MTDPKKLAEEIATRTQCRHGCVSVEDLRDTVLPLLERAREEWVGPLEKALRDCTDDKAERLAEDMDHDNRDHSRWYKAVKHARKLLAPAPSKSKPEPDCGGFHADDCPESHRGKA